ncbi:MAG: UDP-N-acetyl-D-mannosamine dehydrogenase [Rhodospirillales bacterium]
MTPMPASSQSRPFQRLCVIGLGYVGLPTAAVFASRGLQVIGVDVNEEAVRRINKGEIHIVEPELDIMVSAAVSAGKLSAGTKPAPADAFIIAVPTPFMAGHKPDLTYVEAATRALAPVLAKGNLVVVESTSPVGTTEQVSAWLAEERPDLSFPHEKGDGADINVAHSPERVLPGQVLLELVRNDRVVGGVSAACAARTAALYAQAIAGQCLITNARTAELVKLAENAYRDVNIAYANELARVSESLDIDVWDVVRLANRHPRVSILNPGPGVGGHCIAVDPWFIVDSVPDKTPLIQAARAVNDARPSEVADRALKAAADLRAAGKANPVIACLGLAYKPDIDDLRESPAVDVAALLAKAVPGSVLVVEPMTGQLPDELAELDGLRQVDLDRALEDADVIVLLVDHAPFRALDRGRLAGKAVIDTRGIWR